MLALTLILLAVCYLSIGAALWATRPHTRVHVSIEEKPRVREIDSADLVRVLSKKP